MPYFNRQVENRRESVIPPLIYFSTARNWRWQQGYCTFTMNISTTWKKNLRTIQAIESVYLFQPRCWKARGRNMVSQKAYIWILAQSTQSICRICNLTALKIANNKMTIYDFLQEQFRRQEKKIVSSHFHKWRTSPWQFECSVDTDKQYLDVTDTRSYNFARS